MAHHNLLDVTINTGRWTDALSHAKQAVAWYKTGHPRFPALAHDVAFLWCRLNHFSSALPVFEAVLPFMHATRERMVVLANVARAAAAVHDRIRFEEAAAMVLKLAVEDDELTAPALYHVAEGARTLGQRTRARELAARALYVATARGEGTIERLATDFLAALHSRQRRDSDTMPESGSAVEVARSIILRKLRKQPNPTLAFRAVPPEEYPTE